MELFREPEDWQPAGIRTGWVACSDDVPVAVSLACRESGELLALAVDPEFRGQRLGRELLRQAEAWLFSHGWETISLAVDSGVPADFLLRQGWSAEGPAHEGRLIKKSDKPKLLLEEHWLEDPATGYGRLIRLSRGPADRTHPLCLILDGETYWRDMATGPVFRSIADSMPTGMTLAYIGHVSAADRHRDFTANVEYARFLGERVIPWLQQEVAGLADGGHLVVGLSLSGLMAVHLALRYPQLFGACISQSGSHWWDAEDFESVVERLEPVRGRFWLSVGTKETATDLRHPPTGLHQKISQIDGVKNAVRVLGEAGGVVNFHEFEGGHTGECWRDELKEAVRWCLMPEA
ncbi:alpha/beta hydrolase [Luteolibacter arcticus]|nr:GNAT family N-acetyltransferase [Luteolibacter arcticus]